MEVDYDYQPNLCIFAMLVIATAIAAAVLFTYCIDEDRGATPPAGMRKPPTAVAE